jgi:hypothetical protein
LSACERNYEISKGAYFRLFVRLEALPMKLIVSVILVLGGILLCLRAWRGSDNRRATQVWEALARTAERPGAAFDPSMLNGLVEPARRYFKYVIGEAAPIRTVAVIRMSGELGLGTKDKPNYGPMQAEQILAPPHGLVWKLDAGRGFKRITGSDGFDGETSWVRFWLLDTFPVVRAGGTSDHARAAFGRVVAEAVFWAPAALLPNSGVTWEAIGADAARATVTHGGMTQTVDVTVADDGRPTMVVIPRWSDANPEKSYRLQPFGGYLSEFRDFDGYRLPTRVEGGNFIGTEQYFPFYKARIEELRFVAPSSELGSGPETSRAIPVIPSH